MEQENTTKGGSREAHQIEHDELVKKSNVWSSIVEASSDDENGDEPDNQICRAVKTDGNPCGGIRYKDNLYCYNHLVKSKAKPKGRPVALDSLAKKVKVKPATGRSPGSGFAHQEPEVVAPVASIAEPVVKVPSRVCSPRTASNDLMEKLSSRLKVKIDGLDDEMKLLLRMLL
jgi:hypothetical protein